MEGLPQKPKKEESSNRPPSTRRQFLIKAAAFAGAAALGKLGIDQYERAERFEKKHTHESAGTVIKKESVIKPLNIGKLTVEQSPIYLIYVEVDGHKGSLEVRKDFYDAFSVNDKVDVVYVDGETSEDAKIKSIEK